MCFFVALGLVVLFASCGGNDSNSNTPNPEPESKEITKVKKDAIHVFTETSRVSIDSSLDAGLKEREIRWAYQNPGEKMEYSNEATLTFSSESFWTRSTFIRDLVLINYNKEQQKIVSEKFTEKKEKTDFFPVILFFILIAAGIFNVLRKNGQEGNILFGSLILCNLLLGINMYSQTAESIFLGIIVAAVVTCVLVVVILLFNLVFELFPVDRIPMPHNQDNIVSFVLAYALTCALRFIYFADLPWKALVLAFPIFLSPYLVAWTVMATKSIIKKARVKKLNSLAK